MAVLRYPAAFAGVIVVSLLLAGCGGGSSSSPTTTQSAASSVPFDRAFIDGMVPHHASAIQMAHAAKKAGLSNPELVRIASDIMETQQAEIDLMRSWRKQWYGSSEIDPNGAAALELSMEQMGMQHGSMQFAGGGDVDASFAKAMVDHHRGAITMARLAQEKAMHADLRDLADSIITAQEREIVIMEPHASGMHH
jgi:uncharacterized protein (DUF305 family)